MFQLSPFNSTIRPLRLTEWMDDIFESNAFKLDVKKTDKGYHLDAEVPGFDKDSIKISYHDDTLTLEALHNEDSQEDADEFVHQERRHVSLKRSLYLPNIDEAAIKAKLSNGILSVDLPTAVKPSTQIVIDVE